MLACAVPASAATSEKADIAQRARCAAAGKAEEAKRAVQGRLAEAVGARWKRG